MVRETRHLWVGNLPETVREDRIREHFKRYGRVQNVKILPSSEGNQSSSGQPPNKVRIGEISSSVHSTISSTSQTLDRGFQSVKEKQNDANEQHLLHFNEDAIHQNIYNHTRNHHTFKSHIHQNSSFEVMETSQETLNNKNSEIETSKDIGDSETNSKKNMYFSNKNVSFSNSRSTTTSPLNNSIVNSSQSISFLSSICETSPNKCAIVSFMDIKSASKAHITENKIDDKILSTEYYEPSAFPLSGRRIVKVIGISGSNTNGNPNQVSLNSVCSTVTNFNNNNNSILSVVIGQQFPNSNASGYPSNNHGSPDDQSPSGFERNNIYDRCTARNNIIGDPDQFNRRTSEFHHSGDVRGRTRDRLHRNGPYPTTIVDRTNQVGHHRVPPSNTWYESSTSTTGSSRNVYGTVASAVVTPDSGYDVGLERRNSNNDEIVSIKKSSKKSSKKILLRSGSESPPSCGGESGESSRSHSRSPSSCSSTNSTTSNSNETCSPGSGTDPPRTRSIPSAVSAPTPNTSNPNPVVHSEDNRPLAICVRNLPARSSDTSLKDGLFHEYKKHGKVTWVKVVGQSTDRYALVCFKKPDDVEKALEVSHDKLFFGCKIEVEPYQGYDVDDNEFRPYEAELDEYHPKSTRTLFIGNLEKDITANDLRKHFECFGEIIEIDIKKQGVTAYAFCQYSDILSVVKAMRKMDGEHLGNNRIKLGFGKSMPTNCVWIDGISDSVSENYLTTQFNRFGPVSQAAIDRDRKLALVFFEQIQYAQTAVKEMRGITLRGRKLQVDFASRECQEAFYEKLEKPLERERSLAFETVREVSTRGFETTVSVPGARYNRYDTPSRSRTSSFSRHSNISSSGAASPSNSGGTTPRGAARSRVVRYPSDYYDNVGVEFSATERRFKSYDEYSQGSGASHEDVYENETTVYHKDHVTESPPLAGTTTVVLSSRLNVIDSESLSQAITRRRAEKSPGDIRHLQKERSHLLEQLEECPSSSGDELLFSPKKRIKFDSIHNINQIVIPPSQQSCGGSVVNSGIQSSGSVIETINVQNNSMVNQLSVVNINNMNNNNNSDPICDSSSSNLLLLNQINNESINSSNILQHQHHSHRKSVEIRRLSECSGQKFLNSNNSRRPSTDNNLINRRVEDHVILNIYPTHNSICKRRKTSGASENEYHSSRGRGHQLHSHHSHEASGGESADGSRPGTPLCDERPENIMPTEPRRIPSTRDRLYNSEPLCLPLPKFAVQFLQNRLISGSSTLLPTSTSLTSSPFPTLHTTIATPPASQHHISQASLNSLRLTSPPPHHHHPHHNHHHHHSSQLSQKSLPPAVNLQGNSNIEQPPASPARAPSLSSNSSDSEMAPSGSPSLEERIKTLDEMFERWSGGNAARSTSSVGSSILSGSNPSASSTTSLGNSDTNTSSIFVRHKFRDLDVNEVQPSDILKSVLAKKSIFDDDLKRLENISDKYEPREMGSISRSLNSLPSTTSISTAIPTVSLAGSSIAAVKSIQSVPPSSISMFPSPISIMHIQQRLGSGTTTSPMNSPQPISPYNSPSPSPSVVIVAPKTCVVAPVKGLQYPFPSHPPVTTNSVPTTPIITPSISHSVSSTVIPTIKILNKSLSQPPLTPTEKPNPPQPNSLTIPVQQQQQTQNNNRPLTKSASIPGSTNTGTIKLLTSSQCKDESDLESVNSNSSRRSSLDYPSNLNKQNKFNSRKEEKQNKNINCMNINNDHENQTSSKSTEKQKECLDRRKSDASAIETTNVLPKTTETERSVSDCKTKDSDKIDDDTAIKEEKERIEKLEKDKRKREDRERKEKEERERREKDREENERRERLIKEKEVQRVQEKLKNEILEKEKPKLEIVIKEEHDKPKVSEIELKLQIEASAKEKEHDIERDKVKREKYIKRLENDDNNAGRIRDQSKENYFNSQDHVISSKERYINEEFDSKRRDRNSSSSSLSGLIGNKRRKSSQDSTENDELKRIRITNDHRKASDRRDSRDQNKTSDRPLHKQHKSHKSNLFSQSQKYLEKPEKLFTSKENEFSFEAHFIRKETSILEDKKYKDKLIESNIKIDKYRHKKKKDEKSQVSSPEFELTFKSLKHDREDYEKNYLENSMRSSDEEEKHREKRKELKELKKKHQLQQSDQYQSKHHSQESNDLDISKLKEEGGIKKDHCDDSSERSERRRSESKMERKSMRNDDNHKSSSDSSRKTTGSSKTRRMQSTDDSDSDGPKRQHSIFDIPDEGPTYISMYDKVKARSCKNMQKQEEEKKIKAKFTQLKQSRAKREEKKRSTSWDEDSDSDFENERRMRRNNHKSKSLMNSSSEDDLKLNQQLEFHTSDSDNEQLRRLEYSRRINDLCDGDTSDSSMTQQLKQRRKISSRKNSRSTRIEFDTSDDDEVTTASTSKQIAKNSDEISKTELVENIKIKIENENLDANVVVPPLLQLKSIKIEQKSYTSDDEMLQHNQLDEIKIKIESKENTTDHSRTEMMSDSGACLVETNVTSIPKDPFDQLFSPETRRKHKKKQKRQKSPPSQIDIKIERQDEIKIESPSSTVSIDFNDLKKIETSSSDRKKHTSKKEKRRDKEYDSSSKERKEDRNKLRKSKKSKSSDVFLFENSESGNYSTSNSCKRGEKMEDIFGPLSDEDSEHAPIDSHLTNQLTDPSDKLKINTSNVTTSNVTTTDKNITNTTNEKDEASVKHETIKNKQEIEEKPIVSETTAIIIPIEYKKINKNDEFKTPPIEHGCILQPDKERHSKEESRKRKEKKRKDREKTRAAAMLSNEDENSVDLDEAGRALEAQLMEDCDSKNDEINIIEITKPIENKSSRSDVNDLFKFSSENDENTHMSNITDKRDTGIDGHRAKEKKKKKKRSKEEKHQKREHHHHHSHSNPNSTLSTPVKKDTLSIPIPKSVEICIESSSNLSKQSPSLPCLIEDSPPYVSPIQSSQNTSSISSTLIASHKPPILSNISIISKPENKRKQDTIIPGFGGIKVDDQIHDTAVKSISSDFEKVEKSIESPKEIVENVQKSNKADEKLEEKSRAVISQEETEDAVAALLGESFGTSNTDDYSDCYGIETNNSESSPPNPVEPVIPEEDAEEMRKALESLNSEELDIKPDTPQSENDLRIDTDTEELDDECNAQNKYENISKTPDPPEIKRNELISKDKCIGKEISSVKLVSSDLSTTKTVASIPMNIITSTSSNIRLPDSSQIQPPIITTTSNTLAQSQPTMIVMPPKVSQAPISPHMSISSKPPVHNNTISTRLPIQGPQFAMSNITNHGVSQFTLTNPTQQQIRLEGAITNPQPPQLTQKMHHQNVRPNTQYVMHSPTISIPEQHLIYQPLSVMVSPRGPHSPRSHGPQQFQNMDVIKRTNSPQTLNIIRPPNPKIPSQLSPVVTQHSVVVQRMASPSNHQRITVHSSSGNLVQNPMQSSIPTNIIINRMPAAPILSPSTVQKSLATTNMSCQPTNQLKAINVQQQKLTINQNVTDPHKINSPSMTTSSQPLHNISQSQPTMVTYSTVRVASSNHPPKSLNENRQSPHHSSETQMQQNKFITQIPTSTNNMINQQMKQTLSPKTITNHNINLPSIEPGLVQSNQIRSQVGAQSMQQQIFQQQKMVHQQQAQNQKQFQQQILQHQIQQQKLLQQQDYVSQQHGVQTKPNQAGTGTTGLLQQSSHSLQQPPKNMHNISLPQIQQQGNVQHTQQSLPQNQITTKVQNLLPVQQVLSVPTTSSSPIQVKQPVISQPTAPITVVSTAVDYDSGKDSSLVTQQNLIKTKEDVVPQIQVTNSSVEETKTKISKEDPVDPKTSAETPKNKDDIPTVTNVENQIKSSVITSSKENAVEETTKKSMLTEENVTKLSDVQSDNLEQDSKEDSDYWSAKEVNIESVIKKFNPLVSSEDKSEEASASKSELKTQDAIQEENKPETKVEEKIEQETSGQEDDEFDEGMSENPDKESSESSNYRKGRVTRGKKQLGSNSEIPTNNNNNINKIISNHIGQDLSNNGVQTRRGGKSNTARRGRGGKQTGRLSISTTSDDRRSRNANSESDVYEFNEDSTEEVRPRLILTIKSPTVLTATTNPHSLPHSVHSSSNLSINTATTNQSPSNIIQSPTSNNSQPKPSVLAAPCTNLQDATAKEDFPSPAANTRKSRRLQERDVSRNTVDDVIEDVVRNSSTSPKSSGSSPTASQTPPRRSTRQTTLAKPNPPVTTNDKIVTNVVSDVRKSPRANKRTKDRKTSETSIDSSDEKPRNEEKPISDVFDNIKTMEIKPATPTNSTPTAETKLKVDSPSVPQEKPILNIPPSTVSQKPPEPSEPTTLIDPVTGELMVMRQSKEGQYIPVPEESTKIQVSVPNNNTSNGQTISNVSAANPNTITTMVPSQSLISSPVETVHAKPIHVSIPQPQNVTSPVIVKTNLPTTHIVQQQLQPPPIQKTVTPTTFVQSSNTTSVISNPQTIQQNLQQNLQQTVSKPITLKSHVLSSTQKPQTVQVKGLGKMSVGVSPVQQNQQIQHQLPIQSQQQIQHQLQAQQQQPVPLPHQLPSSLQQTQHQILHQKPQLIPSQQNQHQILQQPHHQQQQHHQHHHHQQHQIQIQQQSSNPTMVINSPINSKSVVQGMTISTNPSPSQNQIQPKTTNAPTTISHNLIVKIPAQSQLNCTIPQSGLSPRVKLQHQQPPSNLGQSQTSSIHHVQKVNLQSNPHSGHVTQLQQTNQPQMIIQGKLTSNQQIYSPGKIVHSGQPIQIPGRNQPMESISKQLPVGTVHQTMKEMVHPSVHIVPQQSSQSHIHVTGKVTQSIHNTQQPQIVQTIAGNKQLNIINIPSSMHQMPQAQQNALPGNILVKPNHPAQQQPTVGPQASKQLLGRHQPPHILTGSVASPPLKQQPHHHSGITVPSNSRATIPTVSPQEQNRVHALQSGLTVPTYEASLHKEIGGFGSTRSQNQLAIQQLSPITPGDVSYPIRSVSREQLMMYQLYKSHESIAHGARVPFIPRSAMIPTAGEKSEFPELEESRGASPPLELRRPASGPRPTVPNSLQSPQDRATDSPQVAQVYVHGTRIPHPHYPDASARYHETVTGRTLLAEPPPAHLRPPPQHGVVSSYTPPTNLTPHIHPQPQHTTLIDKEREQREREQQRCRERDKTNISGHASTPSHGNLGPAMSSPSTGRNLQIATPPHASQVPPQADSLLMLLQRYPVMWQGLLALKNDQAAVQMHFVFGNPQVATDSLPCNSDGSTPPVRIAQRMRLEQSQLDGVSKKVQTDNEHCMLLALPCGRDHMDVLQQSKNLQSGFITYLQQKQAAGIVNIAAPGSQQAAYVVHIFPSCDFANENLARIAPDLLHRVAEIAHLLIIIATV